jgi:hypothetical protein
LCQWILRRLPSRGCIVEHVRKSRRMPIGSLHVCAAAAVTPAGVAMVEVVEALL